MAATQTQYGIEQHMSVVTMYMTGVNGCNNSYDEVALLVIFTAKRRNGVAALNGLCASNWYLVLPCMHETGMSRV